MNEKKVAFVFIEAIHGLPDPISDFSVFVKVHPKGENSPGKIISNLNEVKCPTTWPLIYQSELDEFVSITLTFKNNEYAKLLLPIKWFEVNKIVKETFPMRVTDHQAINNKTKVMMTVLIHRSENGECAFNAPQGQLLVQPQWNANQTGNLHNGLSMPTSNINQQLPQQQMVYLNPGQPYMIPISNPNQVMMPMQMQGQFLGQAPFTPNTYQYPVQQLIYPQNVQHSVQNINQQHIQNQSSVTQEQEDIEEPKKDDDQKEHIQQNIQNNEENENSTQDIDQKTQDDKVTTQKAEEPDPKTQETDQDTQEDKQESENSHQSTKEDDINAKPKKDRSVQSPKKLDQDTQKLDPNNKKTSLNQNSKKTIQDNKKTDQTDKKVRSTPTKAESSTQNADLNSKSDQNTQKVDQNSKKVKPTKAAQKSDQTHQQYPESDAIPVLQPMTVYIKTADGKFKQMTLIPSTKSTPAQLVPATKKKQSTYIIDYFSTNFIDTQ